MRVTAPLPLSLVSSNVSASAYDPWSGTTAYTRGDKVFYNPLSDIVGHEYEALTDHTNSPPVVDGTTDWIDLGPDNRSAMFDSKIGTVTSASGSILVSITPQGYFDSIALIRVLNAITITITVTRSGQTLYTDYFNAYQDAAEWGGYFFGERIMLRNAVSIIPQMFYKDCTVIVNIQGTAGQEVSCALLMIGRSYYLGVTSNEPKVGIQDYSTKEVDTFGNAFLLERAYADRASVNIQLNTAQLDAVRRKLATYRASPVLYDLNNDDTHYESLIIFGYYDEFDITLAFPTVSYCTLSVQSLI